MGYCDVNTTCESIERQAKYHRTKQKFVALELSANIFSIVLKYLLFLPGGWEASLSLDKPLSHQHVLKNQNVFWNLDGSWYTVIVLSAFKVRSSQAGKSKSNSCPRKKKPSCELWPICQALLASNVGKRELVLDLQIIIIIIIIFYSAHTDVDI